MEPSVEKKCEDLRRVNSEIEKENRILSDLIASQQKDESKEEEGLLQLAELKLLGERAVHSPIHSPSYGENPLSLKKWDLSPVDPLPVPVHPPLPVERTVFRGACAQAAARDAQCFNPDEQRAPPCAGRPLEPAMFETNLSKRTQGSRGPLNHLQSIAEIASERDGYKARTVKLEKNVADCFQQMAQLYQKYEIKVEVCQRLEEDNQALYAKVQELSQNATLATNEDVEVLKETCRVYQEDFQTEKTERQGADAENKKLREELTEAKKEITDLHEKVMMLLSLLGQQQATPSSPRWPAYSPWDVPRRPASYSGFQRWNSNPTTSQPGDVIRRGRSLYTVNDDDIYDVRDAYADCHCRQRRKSMSL